MTYRDAVRQFKLEYRNLWEKEVDYWTAQFEWSCYTDSLCKEGLITQKQWSTWETPFPYGQRLRKPRLVY